MEDNICQNVSRDYKKSSEDIQHGLSICLHLLLLVSPTTEHSYHFSFIFSPPQQSHIPPLSFPSLSSPPLLRPCLRKCWYGRPAPSLSVLPVLTPSWPCQTRCTSATHRPWLAASRPISSSSRSSGGRSRNVPPLPPPATPPSHYHQTLSPMLARPLVGNSLLFRQAPPTQSSPLSYASHVPNSSRWWVHHSKSHTSIYSWGLFF